MAKNRVVLLSSFYYIKTKEIRRKKGEQRKVYFRFIYEEYDIYYILKEGVLIDEIIL